MATEILDVVRSEMAEMRICERCGALLPTHYALRLCFDCRQEDAPDNYDEERVLARHERAAPLKET